MNPPWRPVWPALIPRLLLILVVALLAWAVLGATWAWATAAVGLLLVVVVQTRQLIVLAGWLKAPDSAEFPDAGGIWGEVFLGLSRHLRGHDQHRQSVEAELHSFKDAIEALPEGIVFLDANQQIRWCNRAATQHLGLILPRDAGAIISQLVRTPGFAEYLERPNADATFLIQSQAALARIYAIQVIPFGERRKILVSSDVTGAKRVEAMRSDFVANVSHELRTPLTVVNGFLEHFSDDGTMSADERRHFARLMTDQTARMLSLVDDLLTLSRLEADDAPASEENIDMAQMLAQLLADGQSLSGGRHRLSASATGPALRGNWKELRSAFGNLVSNAIRYTPDGGDIRIDWCQRDGAGVFTVRDSGVGIPAEHLPRLTERFYRVDRGRSRDTGGTGLGLAIVKHVLLRHQARLGVESTPGEGSTFSAEFPAWRLAATERTTTATAA